MTPQTISRVHLPSYFLGGLTAAAIAGLIAGTFWGFARWRAEQPLMVSPGIDWSGVQQRDPETLWSLTPGLSEVEMTETEPSGATRVWKLSTNALGLRGPEIGVKGQRTRILAIGDSTTFGLGVNDAETWPAQLQRLLDEQAISIEVINAGMPGASAVQGLAYLIREGLALEPDVVIVTFGFNDASPAPFADLTMLGARTANAPWTAPTGTEETRRLSPAEFLETMLQFKRVCHEHGMKLVYTAWPVQMDTVDGYGLDSYLPLIPVAARLTRSPVVELLPAFAVAWRDAYYDAIHAGPGGNAIVAACMARCLHRQFGVGPEPGAPEQPALARAVQAYEESLDSPCIEQTWMCRAASLWERGDFENALAAYREAIDIWPDFVASFDHIDTYYLETGDAAGRIAEWRGIIERHPEANRAYALLAKALATGGKDAEAVAAYQEAIARNPWDKELSRELIQVLVRAQNALEARAVFRALLDTSEDKPTAAAQVVGDALQQGQVAAAAQLAEVCRELSVSLPEGIRNRLATQQP